MKFTILFALLFMCALLPAQITSQREVTKDSFALVVKTDPRTNKTAWFENRTVWYNTGEMEFNSALVGNNPAAPIPATDTAQVVAIYAGTQQGLSNSLVSAATTLINQNRIIARMLENNRAITAAGLPSVFSYVASLNQYKFVDSTGVSALYKFQIGTDPWVNATIEFSGGKLFLKWGTNQSKELFVVGAGHIVVLNYPTAGKELHLYEVEPRWFVSQDRSVKVVRND